MRYGITSFGIWASFSCCRPHLHQKLLRQNDYLYPWQLCLHLRPNDSAVCRARNHMLIDN